MPTPRATETRDEFLDRCMGDAEAVADYPETDQRYAVCNAFWDDREKREMNQIEYKFAPLEGLKMYNEPDAEGVFEGYASVFDITDQGFDIVRRGAFKKSLDSGRPVRMLWNHNKDWPIGRWEEIREDERGLFVRGRINVAVPKGHEVASNLKFGAIDSMSIGYRAIEAMPGDNPRIRELTELKLFEISPVTFPMLEDAKVTDIKSIRTIREFERALRDAGFSQREAKAIAADGFKGLAAHRDDVAADEPEPEGLTALLSEIRLLQETLNA